MSFIWPPLLLLLLAVPVGVWLYRSRERRRAARVAQFGWGRRQAGGRGAASRGPAPAGRGPAASRRRSPSLGITILVLSLARPQSVIGVPRLEGTVILAFDVSGSMAATDVAPTRMEAAKTAALAFVEGQPSSVRIGIVVFSDTGFSTQVPTDDRAALVAAIQRLEPERGTSLGRGILAALHGHREGRSTRRRPTTTRTPPPRRAPDPTPVPAGVYEPAVIVLLTDGENTVEPDPLEAAQAAQGPRRPHRHGRDRQRGRDDARGRGLPGPHPARRGGAPGHRGADRRDVLRGR